MADIYLRQPGFRHSTCETFTKNKISKKENKET